MCGSVTPLQRQTQLRTQKAFLCEVRKPNASDSITMGNGMNEVAQKIGHIPGGTVCDKYGNQVMSNAKTQDNQDVTLILGGRFNLFSISKLQIEGWIMHRVKNGIMLTKGDKTIVFDIVIPTPKGAVFAMYFKRTLATGTEIANPSVTAEGTTLSVKQVHVKYVHANEDHTRQMVQYHGVTLSCGTLCPCEACTIATAKQKNVPKQTQMKSESFLISLLSNQMLKDGNHLSPTGG
jgi:hypothetical protein